MSPWDDLVHYAVANVYAAAGNTCLSLACGEDLWSDAKLTRARYETHDQVVNCLACLVVVEDGAP